MRRLRIFTWHIHGHYLYYLAQTGHDIYLPVREDRSGGYGGRAGTFPWPDNVHEVPVEEVRRRTFDCILFQNRANYEKDQQEVLSAAQRRLPRIYLEHDPPWEHATDQLHWAADPNVLLVHVTQFNRLMWHNGRSPTRVIEHGVVVPEDVTYTGELDRGITAVNNLAKRGRLAGADLFMKVRAEVPVDLVGMGAEEAGGLGEIKPMGLPAFERKYRFFFNPIRYTSLGLAVCEAMAVGMPVVGLATTEMATAVVNGVSGFVDTDIDNLIPKMQELIRNPALARALGNGAYRTAQERFHIGRFIDDWDSALAYAVGIPDPKTVPVPDATAAVAEGAR